MIRNALSVHNLACASLVLASVSFYLDASQQRAESLYSDGRIYLLSEDSDRALRSFQDAANLEPRQPMFYVAHALTLGSEVVGGAMPPRSWDRLPVLSRADEKHLVTASVDYQNAIRLSSDDATLWSNLGWTESMLKHDDIAFAAFRRAVISDPNDVISRLGLGLLYERHGVAEGALEQYAHSIAIFPRLVDSPLFMDLQSRDPTAAAEAVRRSLDILGSLPRSPLVLAPMAKLHTFEGKWDIARREYVSALGDLPNLSFAWSNLGALDIVQGRFHEASTDFQRALFLDARNTVAASGLAGIDLRSGETDEADALYTRAIVIPPISIHAERTWRIYHVEPFSNNDIFPAGFLYYITPLSLPRDLCGERLIEVSNHMGQSQEAERQIETQEMLCAQH